MKKKIGIYVVLTIFICSALFSASLFYANSVNDVLKKENCTYLEEVASQTSEAIQRKFDGDMQMLRAMAIMMGSQKKLDALFWVDSFRSEGLFSEFQRIGVILPNGRGYAQDVNGTNFSDREYFKRAMEGYSYISEPLVDRTTGIQSITYAVPIYSKDKVIGVLAAVINASTYRKMLFTNAFEGKGYSYIVKRTGEPVVLSERNNMKFDNFFQYAKVSSATEKQMRNNMKQGISGKMKYKEGEAMNYVTYVPLNINSWYVVSVVPDSVIQSKAKNLSKLTATACTVTGIIFLAAAVLIMIIQLRSRKKLFALAYHDKLTGYANKNLFLKKVSQMKDTRQTKYAYVMVDVRNFKMVNELFGYAEGNLFLKHMAAIFDRELLENEVCGRAYADVFHLYLEYENVDKLKQRLHKMAEGINIYSFPLDAAYHISVHFGVYIPEGKGILPDIMGDRASLALKQIHTLHGTSIQLYDETIRSNLIGEQRIESDMQRGLEDGEFQVFLQPQYSLMNEQIVSAEALTRWQHQKRGMITPAEFIPVFEKNGFIANLDLYILEEVCKILRRWIDEGRKIIPISVNQSRLNLYLENYIDNLATLLKKYNIPPQLINVEITESAFFEDTNTIIQIIEGLHNVGFYVSMDDFGVGYSSLNMLQNLLVDELKIDKNFFSESADTTRGRKIVDNIISMAKDLNIRVVAEGVETIEELNFLKQTPCDLVQGYYYSKPIPVSEFEKKITADSAE